MSQRHAVQDATGVVATNDGGDIIIACGTTTPGTVAGYSNGCIFIKTDQGDHEGVFVNVGSNTSADFNLVSVTAA